MKLLLDYLPILLFVGAYYLRDIYFATVVLIISLFVQVAILYQMTRRVPKMQLTAAMLALVLGGITLALKDPVFIKVKPTALYGLFAVILIGSHFYGERPVIQRLLESSLHLPAPVWRSVNLMWAAFFIFCGALNLYVAYRFSEAFWVNFKLFGMLGLTLVFVLFQGLYLSRYLHHDS